METIKGLTVINDANKTVHVKITWPEGDEAYVLEHAEQIRARLDDVPENTEIKIEAGGSSESCIYRSSADARVVRLTHAGWFEWAKALHL